MDVVAEAKRKPLATLSAYSYVPPRRREPKEMSFYNREPKVGEVSVYDQVFHRPEGFDVKLHRDDRQHCKGRGLNMHEEELSRTVPVRSSSEYGRHSAAVLFQTGQRHARVASLKSETFMKNGIIRNVEEGYGSVFPS